MNQAEQAILNGEPRLVYGQPELNDKDALILTFFGDGFTENEQELFFAEAKRMAKYMMATAPWDEYADAVKIYAIGVCSNESGVRADHARTQAEADADTRDSAFRASFWTSGMQRLVEIAEEDMERVRRIYREKLPATDYAIVMVNSEVYGGSGGEISIVSRNDESLEMLLHELGHTIGILSDEYFAGNSYAGEYVNMSAESDPKKVRWSRFIGKNGIGVYEYDNGGDGWFKPHQNCKMRYLGRQFPFCEVCKEALRDQFSAHSNVTKLFWQQYADTLREGEGELNLRQYVIVRRGGKKETGEELGDRLKLSYFDEAGKALTAAPTAAGSYRLRAELIGDAVYGDAVLETTFEIEPPDLIDLEVENKVCDGKPIAVKAVLHDAPPAELRYSYSGTMPYAAEITHLYEDTLPPVLPGRYTVTVTAHEKGSEKLLSRKSKEFEISLHTSCIADHNTLEYPGAQPYYNNQTIVFTGEGYSANELDKFEADARRFVDYFRSLPLYKEADQYFNYYTVQAVSEGTHIGKEPSNTYYHVSRSDEGKLVQTDAGTRAAMYMANNGITSFYKAVIVLVNGVYDVVGTTVTNKRFIVYAPTDEKGMRFAAMELLNYLSGKPEGVRAVTEEEKAVQRTEFLSALYRQWEEYDYAPILSRAYEEEFKATGEPVDLSAHFHTYVHGHEVKVPYRIRYYEDKNGERGAELSGAPKEPGTYRAFAELVLDEGKDTCEAELDGEKFSLPLARYETQFTIRA